MGNGVGASIHGTFSFLTAVLHWFLLTNTYFCREERLPNGEINRRSSLDDYDSQILGALNVITEGFSSHNLTTRKALRDACRRGLHDRVVECVETHKVPVDHNTTMIGMSPSLFHSLVFPPFLSFILPLHRQQSPHTSYCQRSLRRCEISCQSRCQCEFGE